VDRDVDGVLKFKGDGCTDFGLRSVFKDAEFLDLMVLVG